MKKTKKIMCLLLAIIVLIPNIALFGTVSAQTADEEPLKIEVSTDKSNYSSFGIANITVTVTNTSYETINNICAEAVFEQLAPLDRKTSETFKEVESLQSGESFAFSYKATLNASKFNLNFFEKIILWFVRLFNGGYSATSHNIEAVIENTTEIVFGNYTAENIIETKYDQNNNSEKWYSDVDDKHVVITDDNGHGYIDNRVIIIFHINATDEQKQTAVDSVNGKIIGKTADKYQLEIPSVNTLSELNSICQRLNSLSGVFYAFYEATENLSYIKTETSILKAIPNDPWKDTFQGVISGSDWNESNPSGINWYLEAIDALSAWNYNERFSKIKIGIVDGGFETAHEDLDINILNHNENENDNKFLEDVLEGGQNHGTHVAGIIGATANNQKGITGIVWNKELYCVDVFATRKQEQNNISILSTFEGIERTLQEGCKVINMSIGMSEPLENTDSIIYQGALASAYLLHWEEKFNRRDFIIVQSAGNSNCDSVKNGSFSSITDESIQFFSVVKMML